MTRPTTEAAKGECIVGFLGGSKWEDCIECGAASPYEVLDQNGVCAQCIANWACKPCGKPIQWPHDFCESCEYEQELECHRGPQTLADVGMCEADFR